jgi:hypothetical protein
LFLVGVTARNQQKTYKQKKLFFLKKVLHGKQVWNIVY